MFFPCFSLRSANFRVMLFKKKRVETKTSSLKKLKRHTFASVSPTGSVLLPFPSRAAARRRAAGAEPCLGAAKPHPRRCPRRRQRAQEGSRAPCSSGRRAQPPGPRQHREAARQRRGRGQNRFGELHPSPLRRQHRGAELE